MNRLQASYKDLPVLATDDLSSPLEERLPGDDRRQSEAGMSYYQRANVYLFAKLYRSQCPSGLTLSYYCLPDALSEAERHYVASHVGICPLCANELAETKRFLEE